MKIITNQTEINMARELAGLKSQIKTLEKRHDEIVSFFKTNYKGESLLKLDSFVVIMKDQERSTLDRKALEAQLGIDNVLPFVKTTNSVVLTVQEA